MALEKEEQYLAYQELCTNIERRLKRDIRAVIKIYEQNFEGFTVTDKFKISIKQFIHKLGASEVKQAMEKSCTRLDNNASLKYFCGICWNKIREND